MSAWTDWKENVYADCPVATKDRTRCRPNICPCRRLKLHQMDEWYAERIEPWFSVGAGRIGGVVKIGRLLSRRKEKDGNG